MKKPFLSFVALFLFILLGCHKSSVKTDTGFPANQPLILHSSSLVDIRVSDIISTISYFKRQIEIIDRRDNSIYKIFIITAKNKDNNTNIYTALKNKPLTGTMTIESENSILLVRESMNGHNVIIKKDQNSEPQMAVMSAASCSISTVHGCVALKLTISIGLIMVFV